MHKYYYYELNKNFVNSVHMSIKKSKKYFEQLKKFRNFDSSKKK